MKYIVFLTILLISTEEVEKSNRYDNWSTFSGLPDIEENFSEITFDLHSDGNSTKLTLTHINFATETKKPNSIDEYIANHSDDVQEILEKVRATIRENATEAKETISYQIPTFTLNGNLVHFAAFKKHIGFYPTPSAIEKFKNELTEYETAKGSVKFPLNKPIPYDLIAKMTEFRVGEQKNK